MDIIYLTDLKNNPVKYGIKYEVNIDFNIEGLTIAEIEELELLYNAGSPFPQALRELLFLAGKYCYVLDYGGFNNLQRMQELVYENMIDSDHIITRPFFAIDIYNASDAFLFIYLDESSDPVVYCGNYEHEVSTPEWIYKISDSLSEFINRGVALVKAGRSPF